MPNCAVPQCNNNNRNTSDDIVFHQFPKDSRKQKQWIHAIKRADKVNFKTATVCSSHFEMDDYVRDLENELMGLTPRRKRRLLETTIHHLNLPINPLHTQKTIAENNLRGERVKRRGYLAELNQSVENFCSERDMQESSMLLKDEMVQLECDKLKNKFTAQEQLIIELQGKIHALEDQVSAKTSMIHLLRQEVVQLKLQRTRILARSKTKNTTTRKIPLQLENFKNIFTSKQISAILSNRRVRKWATEDIASALTLKARSRRIYQHIRKNMKIPLPSISTLQKRTSHFHITTGLIPEVVEMVQHQLSSQPEIARLTSLCFDEMSVDAKICFDESTQQVMGPHSELGVIMSRGLCYPRKQPIYAQFDESLSKSALLDVVKSMSEKGCVVKTFCNDLGPKNQGTWKELNVTHEKPYFVTIQQEKEEKVFVFGDFPHLLKCLRNAFLDHGIFILQDPTLDVQLESKKRKKPKLQDLLAARKGVHFTKTMLADMIVEDSSEFKIFHHLKQSDLEVSGQERQKFEPANHVFCEKTAAGVRAIAIKQGKAIQNEVLILFADFIKLMSDFKDLMLSSVIRDSSYPTKSAYGVHLNNQNKVLDEIRRLMNCMYIPSKKGTLRSRLPFMNGIRQTIRALELLFEDLNPRGVEFILCKKLNQNCLENLFSQIRGMGRHSDSPPPNEALNRLRVLLLGQHTLVSERQSVKNEDARVNYISSLISSKNEKPEVQQTKHIPVVYNREEDSELNLSLLETEDKTFCESEGETYVAGYIAFKIRKKYPNLIKLGTPTGQVTTLAVSPWLQALSHGGLTQPSDDWMEKFDKLNYIFISLHGPNDTLNRSPGIISHLRKLCEEALPDLPKEVIRLYARTRTFIRLRFANYVMKKRLTNKPAGKLKSTKVLEGKETNQAAENLKCQGSTKVVRNSRKLKHWKRSTK